MVILSELPDDIVISILLRLPVKSLMRCRCVCRSWCHLVSEPYFIHSHLKEQCAHEKGYLISRCQLNDPYEDYYYSLRCDEKFLKIMNLEFPFRGSTRDFNVVGSSKGLLFVLDPMFSECDRNMFFWNPCIRKIKRLPSSPATYQKSISHVVFGFGFLPEINDYNVIRVLYYEHSKSLSPIKDLPVTEIYSLKSDSWTRIETVVPYFTVSPLSRAFLNGFFYWVARFDENHCTDCIVSFDMTNKTFQEIVLPEPCLSNGKLIGSLTVFRECLYMFARRFDQDWSLWMMKENGSEKSWSKICILENQDEGPWPLGFMKNGEVILETEAGKLFLHDPRTLRSPGKYMYTLYVSRNMETDADPTMLDTFAYSASLALLDRGNGVMG